MPLQHKVSIAVELSNKKTYSGDFYVSDGKSSFEVWLDEMGTKENGEPYTINDYMNYIIGGSGMYIKTTTLSGESTTHTLDNETTAFILSITGSGGSGAVGFSNQMPSGGGAGATMTYLVPVENSERELILNIGKNNISRLTNRLPTIGVNGEETNVTYNNIIFSANGGKGGGILVDNNYDTIGKGGDAETDIPTQQFLISGSCGGSSSMTQVIDNVVCYGGGISLNGYFPNGRVDINSINIINDKIQLISTVNKSVTNSYIDITLGNGGLPFYIDELPIKYNNTFEDVVSGESGSVTIVEYATKR